MLLPGRYGDCPLILVNEPLFFLFGMVGLLCTSWLLDFMLLCGLIILVKVQLLYADIELFSVVRWVSLEPVPNKVMFLLRWHNGLLQLLSKVSALIR